MTEFTVGDRVRCVTRMEAHGLTIERGDLGTVVEAVPGNCPRINWDGKPLPEGFPGWGCSTTSIERALTAEPEAFAVGETLIGEIHPRSHHRRGEVRGSLMQLEPDWNVPDDAAVLDGWFVKRSTLRRPNAEPAQAPQAQGASTPTELETQPADPYAGCDLNAYGIPRRPCSGPHDFDLFHTECRECGFTDKALIVMRRRRDTAGPYAPKGGLSEAWIAAYMSGADETYLKSGRSLRISAARPPRGEREVAGHPASFPEGAHHDAEELYTS